MVVKLILVAMQSRVAEAMACVAVRVVSKICERMKVAVAVMAVLGRIFALSMTGGLSMGGGCRSVQMGWRMMVAAETVVAMGRATSTPASNASAAPALLQMLVATMLVAMARLQLRVGWIAIDVGWILLWMRQQVMHRSSMHRSLMHQQA
jgi:hypothetical protein